MQAINNYRANQFIVVAIYKIGRNDRLLSFILITTATFDILWQNILIITSYVTSAIRLRYVFCKRKRGGEKINGRDKRNVVQIINCQKSLEGRSLPIDRNAHIKQLSVLDYAACNAHSLSAEFLEAHRGRFVRL